MADDPRKGDPRFADAFPREVKKAVDRVIKSPTTPESVRKSLKEARRGLGAA